jgi:hypothetical protein
MPLNEIDEIFAKRPHAGPSKQPASKKRQSPRTVSESSKKRVKVEKVKKRKEGKKDDDLKRFKDSRGSGPRQHLPPCSLGNTDAPKDAQRTKATQYITRMSSASVARVVVSRHSTLPQSE